MYKLNINLIDIIKITKWCEISPIILNLKYTAIVKSKNNFYYFCIWK